MAFFDLFTVVAGNYPADQFFQVVFNTDNDGTIGASVTLTVGPRSDTTQLKQYTITDKEAFATAVQDKIAAGSEAMAAFAATLPEPDATVTQGPVVTPPPTPAPVVETPVETPAATTPTEPVVPAQPIEETPATTTTEAPSDQS